MSVRLSGWRVVAIVVMALVSSMLITTPARAAGLTMRVAPSSVSAGLMPLLESVDPCPAPPAGQYRFMRVYFPDNSTQRVYVPNSPSDQTGVRYGTSDGAWSVALLREMPLGTSTINAACEYIDSETWQVKSSLMYDPVTLTVDSPKPTVSLTGTTVPIGGSVTLSSGETKCPYGNETVLIGLFAPGQVYSPTSYPAGRWEIQAADDGSFAIDLNDQDGWIKPGTYTLDVVCLPHGDPSINYGKTWLEYETVQLTYAGTTDPIPTPTPTPPTSPAKPMKILVMGDSFSAGNGASEAYKGPKGCFRSAYNYAEHFGGMLYPSAKVRNVACSGAPSSAFEETFNDQPPQVSEIKGNEDIIMLTTGGDDNGIFYGIVSNCLIPVVQDFKAKPCDQSLKSAEDFVGTGLATGDDTKQTLGGNVQRALLSVRASNSHATVVVLGYPYLEGNSDLTAKKVKIGARLKAIQDAADTSVKNLVAQLNQQGGHFVFVSQISDLPQFPVQLENQVDLSSHAPYDGYFLADDTWFVAPFSTAKKNKPTWYHPNPAGWYAEALLLYYSPQVPKTVTK